MPYDPVQNAIDEQGRGIQFKHENIRGTGSKDLTRGQLVRARRRTENILIEMADKISAMEQARKPKKRSRRRRRRGPKVMVWSPCQS